MATEDAETARYEHLASMSLSDAEARYVRYFLSGVFSERRIANRAIPKGVLDIHRKLTKYLSDDGHEDSQRDCGEQQLNQDDDLIGTATAASLLGCSERTVRRRARELGGVRPDGRTLVLRRSVVARAARRNHEE